ncbi:MAG: isopenicillin N synthase family dioxygenase [bacterium]
MLPILDIAPFLANPFGEDARKFCDRLALTCHDPGFFFLTGHQISERDNDDLLAVARNFFDLPKTERHDIAIVNSPHFRGYTVLGDERTQGERDWRDQIDIGPEEPALVLGQDDPLWLRLRGPNQWPVSLPELQITTSSWAAKIDVVAMELFRALAMGLDQDYHYFDDKMTPDPYFRIKVSRYPGQVPSSSIHQGLGLHHDSGLFTFILQNQVTGLQVEHNGDLHDISPIPGAFIVNLGEMFQAMTNGFLKATKHQVVSPPLGQQRISIAYFMNPRLDAVFDSIPLPSEYATLATGGQNADPNDPIHTTFGENTLKIRMRAHPDVVAAHYQNKN